MGVLKLFEGTGDLYCAIATIRTTEGVVQKVIDGAAFSVGRATDCVLSIPDVGISRLHLLVTIKRGEVYISDQGSANGTFLNGERVEAKRLIHVKSSDEIKLGKSEVIMQFNCMEKHFKTDFIAESLLPQNEKDNLLSLIKASHHKAQEVVALAQSQADQIVQMASEKARNIENQTLLMQEDILSKAQVESQGIISDTKRKSAQMIFEAEEKAREATHNIHVQADNTKFEADEYYKARTKEAQTKGDEIIAHHTKMGQQLIEDLRKTTLEKAEKEAKEQLSGLYKNIEERAQELNQLESEINIYKTTKRSEIDADLARIRQDFLLQFESDRQKALDEHHSKIAVMEAEFLHKKNFLEEEETKKIEEIEKRSRELQYRLESEYTENRKQLDEEFAEKRTHLESDLTQRQSDLEAQFEKQKLSLEKETEAQRQSLIQIQSEFSSFSGQHSKLKSQVEELQLILKGLQKTEQDLLASVQNKRTESESIVNEQRRVTLEIAELDAKMRDLQSQHANLKSSFDANQAQLEKEHEAQVQKYQDQISQLKKTFEDEQKGQQEKHESNRQKYIADIESLRAKYESESQRLKKEADLDIQKSRAEIVKKTQDYVDLEKIKLDEYRSQMLNEKKQMELKFESTKKEFELKTREMIDFEKKKLEDKKQEFLAILNAQRAGVINELTRAIIKIEKRGDPSQSTQLISQAVESVFDSHVAELSVTTQMTNTPSSANTLKAQWMSYGVGVTLALVISFKFFIQPQINRHIAGTAENAAAAAVSKERPKFQRAVALELKDKYVDSIISTQRYAEIYTDEELHNKWHKHITSYMFENWRVPEEKTIEAVAIAKSLVMSLEKTAQNLDQEFANQGVEKMRETEEDAIKRISDVLGTQVKFEAFKRKEKEFFEPYIMNQ